MATKAAANDLETDDETKAIIYEGATIRQLAIMFRADPKVVSRKVAGLVPVGRRRGNNVYRVDEAASRLVKPGYDIERYIREMNHTDLPPLLAKEFWNAQRARQTFEENEGDLWRTADVVQALGEAFNTCRMALLLIPDAVERQTGLTDQQRVVIKSLVDGALADLRHKLKDRFKDYGMGHNSGAGQLIDLRPTATDDSIGGGAGVPSDEEESDPYRGL